MANNIQLTADDILKKKFKSKVKGYSQEEVDSYLDQIISDYKNYDQIIANLQSQIQELNEQLTQAKKAQVTEPRIRLDEDDDVKTYRPTKASSTDYTQQEDNSNEITTNVAMIQRISTLERKVYNLEQRMNNQSQDKTYQAN